MLFEDHGLEHAEMLRAYNMAAEAGIQRMFELEQSVKGLPDLGAVEDEDLVALDAFRLRLRRRHAGLLDRVSSHLAEKLEDGPFMVTEGRLRVCAWCHRTASHGERWLPVGHLMPDGRDVPVTHTICGECVQRHDQG